MNLGELEKLLLQHLWEVHTADAKEVHSHFCKMRGGSLNTIQSTLDRLYKKGLLKREKYSHAFRYEPALAKHEFIGQLIEEVTQDFMDDDESSFLMAFDSLSERLTEEEIKQLEDLLEARRHKEDSTEGRSP